MCIRDRACSKYDVKNVTTSLEGTVGYLKVRQLTQTSRGIMDLLERINRTGTTVLVATHDREMVDNMRRRVIALDRGHLTRDQDRGVYGFDV